MTVSVANYIKGGLTPLGKRGARPNNGGINWYPVANGQAEAIYKGDPVRVAGGTVSVCPNGGTPTGVAVGFKYATNDRGTIQSNHLPSGTSMGAADGYYDGGYNQPLVAVVDDPDQEFLILARTSSGAAGLQSGSFAKCSAQGTGAGDYSGQSYAELDITGTDVSAGAAMFQVVGPYLAPGFDEDADSTPVRVRFNPNLVNNPS